MQGRGHQKLTWLQSQIPQQVSATTFQCRQTKNNYQQEHLDGSQFFLST